MRTLTMWLMLAVYVLAGEATLTLDTSSTFSYSMGYVGGVSESDIGSTFSIVSESILGSGGYDAMGADADVYDGITQYCYSSAFADTDNYLIAYAESGQSAGWNASYTGTGYVDVDFYCDVAFLDELVHTPSSYWLQRVDEISSGSNTVRCEREIIWLYTGSYSAWLYTEVWINGSLDATYWMPCSQLPAAGYVGITSAVATVSARLTGITTSTVNTTSTSWAHDDDGYLSITNGSISGGVRIK